MTDTVQVVQDDRDAAAKIRVEMSDEIKRGNCDHWSIVQAFARHRLAALEEAAKVADDAATDISLRLDNMVRIRAAKRRIDAWKERRNGLVNVAAAIRNLKGQP